MEVFVSKLTEKFSIKQISELLKKPYPLIHRSIKPLIEEGFIIKDNKNLLSLNYKENLSELVYVESLRKKEFLMKNGTVALFAKDVFERIALDFFTFLVFGSSTEKKDFRDLDILFVIEDKDKIKETEKILDNIASNFSKKFDISVLSKESVYEMLVKREQKNVMNESLNKHILLFGAENYYRMLKNAR